MTASSRRVLYVVTALALLAVLAPAAARAAEPWATVNICDTKRNPNKIGVRGAMWADDKVGTMWMRFRVQSFDPLRKAWVFAGGEADSGYVFVGSSHGTRGRQAGRTFAFPPPAAGADPLRLRGVVTFQWRRGTTIRRQRLGSTKSGHRSAAGADPRGFSAAECKLT